MSYNRVSAAEDNLNEEMSSIMKEVDDILQEPEVIPLEKVDNGIGISQNDNVNHNYGMKTRDLSVIGLIILLKFTPIALLAMFFILESILRGTPSGSKLLLGNIYFGLLMCFIMLHVKNKIHLKSGEGNDELIPSLLNEIYHLNLWYNIFICYWCLTFVYHVLQEVHNSYITCLFVTLLHVFFTCLYQFFPHPIIVSIQGMLIAGIPMNDPLTLGVVESFHRSFLSAVIFNIDVYITKAINKKSYDIYELFSAIIPIWRGIFPFHLIYFSCYLVYRIAMVRKDYDQFCDNVVKLRDASIDYASGYILKDSKPDDVKKSSPIGEKEPAMKYHSQATQRKPSITRRIAFDPALDERMKPDYPSLHDTSSENMEKLANAKMAEMMYMQKHGASFNLVPDPIHSVPVVTNNFKNMPKFHDII